MASTVHVFNLFSEPVSDLVIGGHRAGGISGYADGSAPDAPIYTPACLTVPRTKSASGSAAFAIGDNSLIIPWQSFRGATTITIPSPAGGVSLDDPLILQLAVNSALLLTTRGYLLATFPVQLSTGAGLDLAPEPS